ncbi:hypothetical protein GQ457_12G002500 [Hibiscus cannabinus]
MHFVVPGNVSSLVLAWMLAHNPFKSDSMWKICLFGIIWSIWLTRNDIIFKAVGFNENQLFDSIMSKIWGGDPWYRYPRSSTGTLGTDTLNPRTDTPSIFLSLRIPVAIWRTDTQREYRYPRWSTDTRRLSTDTLCIKCPTASLFCSELVEHVQLLPFSKTSLKIAWSYARICLGQFNLLQGRQMAPLTSLQRVACIETVPWSGSSMNMVNVISCSS